MIGRSEDYDGTGAETQSVPRRSGRGAAILLTSADVVRLLPMATCVQVMESTFRALAEGRAIQPLRQVITVPDGAGALYAMPGYLGDAGPGALAVKLVTLFPGNGRSGLDTHQGVIVLFDAHDGRLLSLIEAASVTAIRTAAVSALATRLLATAEAAELAILGSGVQARSHLAAMLEVRPIRHVRVWSRSAERARAFAIEMSARFDRPVRAVHSAGEAVGGADVVCTVTGSRTPLFSADQLAPGAHINAVGSSTPDARELDTRTVVNARLFVDSREAALAEAGDLLLAIADGEIGPDHICGELADLVTERVAGRVRADDITIFKSLGLAVEDAAAARQLYEKALETVVKTIDIR